MKLIVIIATAGRRDLISRLLMHLKEQTRAPDEVVVSAPAATDVGAFDQLPFATTCIYGGLGLTVQRNLALSHALDRGDVITFFDDDFLPATDYLERLMRAFEVHADWAVICGNVIEDGASGPGLTFEEGLAALRDAETSRSQSISQAVCDQIGGYGCNMSVRAGLVRDLRFDERLVLYGWQEDVDFTCQLRSRGRVVSLSTLIGVHLGVKAGRVSGIRLGYSQIANPIYLIRKGTVPASFALALMGRNIVANVGRSIRPEPHIDRRGRLKGNLLAAFHLIQGRLEPEHILKL